jgi:hypothetical protein
MRGSATSLSIAKSPPSGYARARSSAASGRELGKALDEILSVAGYVFAVTEVEPVGRELASPPLDGPKLKFRFGRYLERIVGRPIFDALL